jgi:hypothetical protein
LSVDARHRNGIIRALCSLNGWHRLFVAVAFSWACIVVAYGYVSLDQLRSDYWDDRTQRKQAEYEACIAWRTPGGSDVGHFLPIACRGTSSGVVDWMQCADEKAKRLVFCVDQRDDVWLNDSKGDNNFYVLQLRASQHAPLAEREATHLNFCIYLAFAPLLFVYGAGWIVFWVRSGFVRRGE